MAAALADASAGDYPTAYAPRPVALDTLHIARQYPAAVAGFPPSLARPKGVAGAKGSPD
jgi:hypothetical protein